MTATPNATPEWRGWLTRNVEPLVLIALLIIPFLLTPRLGTAGFVTAIAGSGALLLNIAGMLLVYRADGYLNFAQVQFGVVAAALFDGINRSRILLRPLESFCPTCATSPGPGLLMANFVIAALAALATGALVSLIVQVAIMQRMRSAPRLMATVITVFIAQALAAVTPRLLYAFSNTKGETGTGTGTAPPGFNPFAGSFRLAGAEVSYVDVLLLVTALSAVVILAVGLRRGGWGLALRAVATNRDRAGTLGINAARVSRRVWLIAGLLSSLAAILPAIGRQAQAISTKPDSGEVYTAGIQIVVLVLMLTVLVFARFTSLAMAAAAAFVFSILTEAVTVAFGSPAWMNAAYVVLLSAVLLLRSESSTRLDRADMSGDDMVREIHRTPRELAGLEVLRGYRRIAVILASVAVIAAPVLLARGTVSLLVDALLFALVALSVYLITGWAGYVSFGQFGFAAVAGWVAAVSGLPLIAALPVGILSGTLASVLLGLPALRLRGLYLAITTIAFALSAQVLLLDPRLLGGLLPDSVRAPALFGLPLDDDRAFYYLTLAVTAVTVAAVIGLRRARFGRALIALRSNPAAARSFGIAPLRLRLTAFAVAGALASTAGVLSVFHHGSMAPEQFAASMSFTVYLNTLLGGLGGIAGPLIGAAFYAAVNLFFGSNALLTYAATGIGAVLLLIAVPGGLLEAYAKLRDSALLRMAYRLRIPVPRLMGDGGVAASQGKALLDEKRRSLRRPGTTALPSYVPDSDQWHVDPAMHKESEQA